MIARKSLFVLLLIPFLLVSGPVQASTGGDSHAARADYILIEKAKRRMTLFHEGEVIRQYRIGLGKGGLAPKVREGDGRTPEGVYRISGRNPDSAYHLSLRISYPGPDDIKRARMLGVSPGGDIMIHGYENGTAPDERSRLPKDWTLGCIAVTNTEIREIWKLVPDGTPIAIRP
jgi:murein L,D-transpeptidase YafK